jgi:hypothetical protein
MRIRPIVAAAVTAVAVSAVGVSAYTATIASTPGSKVLGFGTTTISGATMDSNPVFTYNTDHSQITAITVVLQGNTSASALSVSRNAAAPVACGAGDNTAVTTTSYACTGLTFAVAGMTSLAYVLE